MISKACRNILSIIKLKILQVTNISYRSPQIMSIVASRIVDNILNL